MHQYKRLGKVIAVDEETDTAFLDNNQSFTKETIGKVEEGRTLYWKNSMPFSYDIVSVLPCSECENEMLVGDDDFICPVCNSRRDFPEFDNETTGMEKMVEERVAEMMRGGYEE